jgi:hypothetical protein
MARLEYKNDRTRALEEAEGSDGRLNVSSRSDDRSYYNSRDEGQTYSMTFEHPAAADGQYSFYLQNTSTSKALVIASIECNSDNIARLKLWQVTGTAANGVSLIPHNLNFSSSNDALVTALHDGGGTAISGLTAAGIAIDQVSVAANGHENMQLKDRLRLGQNDAVALEMDTGTSTPLIFGVIFFYFE